MKKMIMTALAFVVLTSLISCASNQPTEKPVTQADEKQQATAPQTNEQAVKQPAETAQPAVQSAEKQAAMPQGKANDTKERGLPKAFSGSEE